MSSQPPPSPSPPPGNRPVTLKMVAQQAGLHPSAISLALRNHPSIPETTRARVRAIAARMGYRPNPQVAALMQYLRGSRTAPAGTNLLLLNPQTDPNAPTKLRYLAELWAGARARAETLGFAIDELWLGQPGMIGPRFNKIARTRNVAGVFLGSLQTPGSSLPIDWSPFASVAFGWTLHEPRLHRVISHQFHLMRELLRQLRQRGYQRIALVETADQISRVDGTYLAAFLEFNHLIPPKNRLPPLILPNSNLQPLARFLFQHRPDAIVNEFLPLHQELPKLGYPIPRKIALATPNRTSAHDPNLAGMDQNFTRIGATAIDVLAGLISRNERGPPETPRTIMIEGFWVDGWSAPPKPSPKPARSKARP